MANTCRQNSSSNSGGGGDGGGRVEVVGVMDVIEA